MQRQSPLKAKSRTKNKEQIVQVFGYQMVQRLLHGTLNATIYEVDKLRTGCGFTSCSKGKTFLGQVKKLAFCYHRVSATKLYATVDLDKARVARTKLVENHHSNPRWVQTFRIFCAHTISNLVFTIKDNNTIAATLIGRAYVPVEDIMSGFIVDRWVPILDEHHIPIPGRSKIHVKLQFSSVTHDKNWSQGIKTPEFEGVPNTFFLQRQGCKVTLYQDAHVDPDFHPRISNFYEPGKCWEDIFDVIMNAKHVIYISGWSVYTKISLVRDKTNVNLGDMLIRKANEGVTVLLLVWQDRTSFKDLNGLMATHDEETELFFRNSKVHCVLCPREQGSGRSIVQGFEISTMFTHHQKSIVVDSDIGGLEAEKRRLVSFVGGIDLCDGRYDTQEHALFKTLGTTHNADFHQPNFDGASVKKGGPREPWHDIHCRLEGPIAWDVLYNFEQRWRKQVTGQNRDYLLPITKLDQMITRPSQVTTSDDPETWNVQLFRSIDSSAAADLPPSPHQVSEIGLVNSKNEVIDRSIQDAYIQAIRRAKNFIYIENQYFLGSSFGWKSSDMRDEDVGALHLIPKELSLKIVSKIEAGERFVVYVVIPMWPEGKPEGEAVQAILDWQRRTMEMMYVDIARALQAKGTHAHPWDYLSFFCLGNREADDKDGEYVPPERPEPGSNYMRAQESRRFMIYVHSKMMIVDDEYIIIGSANINQRSMDGGRDTEIAMGGFQPHHIMNNSVPARGQIFGFRMSLWYEHVRLHHHSFQYPESLECVQIMDQIAERNWELYSSSKKQDTDLPIHLLRYPITISSGGYVTSLDFFPDTKARVVGKKSDYLPSILTV